VFNILVGLKVVYGALESVTVLWCLRNHCDFIIRHAERLKVLFNVVHYSILGLEGAILGLFLKHWRNSDWALSDAIEIYVGLDSSKQ